MNNNKIYIILSIFALLFLFLIVFFVWPLSKEIEKNSLDLVSAKNDIVSLSAQIKETENFKKNYESYRPNLEKIEGLFVDQNDPVNFIEFLENTANNSQIISQNSLISNNQGQDFISFQISVHGSFSAVGDFLKKIEFGPYLVEIENLNIQNSQSSNVTQNLLSKNIDATLTIKAFTKK